MKLTTCEQVSNGHSDKIADQISDAVLTDCLRHDKNSRVAIECMLKDNHVIVAGELSSEHAPDYPALIHGVFDRIVNLGYETDDLDIQTFISQQSPDIALGVDKRGAGDQGMMFGYATNETPELLPIPFAVATRFLKKMRDYNGKLRPLIFADAKSQVSFDYEKYRITTFLCSVHHAESLDLKELRLFIGKLMKDTASEYGLNTDFKVFVNPTGRFAIGGPYADSGLTGRKLACDSYGGVGHIGGGAYSGKDPSKVDRSGAYMARKIARDIVLAGYAGKCEVQIAYAIGVAQPVSVDVETFGTGIQTQNFIEKYVRDNYDLTPKGIIDRLDLLNVDYNLVSAYGHFGNNGMPWEV